MLFYGEAVPNSWFRSTGKSWEQACGELTLRHAGILRTLLRPTHLNPHPEGMKRFLSPIIKLQVIKDLFQISANAGLLDLCIEIFQLVQNQVYFHSTSWIFNHEKTSRKGIDWIVISRHSILEWSQTMLWLITLMLTGITVWQHFRKIALHTTVTPKYESLND